MIGRSSPVPAITAFVLGALPVQAAAVGGVSTLPSSPRRCACGDDHPDRGTARPTPAAINGITDLRTTASAGIYVPTARIYPRILSAAFCCWAPCSWRASWLARQARPHPGGDAATRRTGSAFRATDVRNYKTFVFCLASDDGRRSAGRCSPLQVGFMSPSFVGIVPSIEMVIFCAVGGRQSIVGRGRRNPAGELGQDSLLEAFPPALVVSPWAAMFIAVVIAFAARVGRRDDRPGSCRGSQVDRRPSRPAEPGAGGIGGERRCPAATDFLTRARRRHGVSFDGFKAVNEHQSLHQPRASCGRSSARTAPARPLSSI